MFRLLVLVMLATAAYFGAKHFELIGSGNVQLVHSGADRVVVAHVDDGKVTYSINGPAEETYMVFAGNLGGSSFAHGSFNAIELTTMRRIAKRYPDFHRCDSAGAPEAKKASEYINVVGQRAMMRKLDRAFADAGSRERSGGERLCASVRGNWLTLEQLEKGEHTVTGAQYDSMLPAHAIKQYFLHVETLETRDCKDAI